MDLEAFERAVARHDQAVAASGQQIWLGSEPTFTARMSAAPEWLGAALGDEKEVRARALVTTLAELRPRTVLMRSLGRNYPGEDHPRFCYGLLRNRDGSALWNGPPDPLIANADKRDAVIAATDSDDAVHAMQDALAARGLSQVAVDAVRDLDAADDAPPTVRVALPACESARAFRELLSELSTAARSARLSTLIIAGFGPPADPSLEWMTVTPDPGVVEVNMAPCIDVREFLHEQRTIYAAAERNTLHPYRLYYNGELTDSGGGGHLTFGGPSLDDSPFFVTPHLLPRLIAYFVRHPSLSYWFASASVGSSSQSPRVDESAPESFGELGLALHLLARHPAPTPELIWQTFAPLLTDRFGNSHRAEINVEKLCNPYLPGRGKLGVVELRAMRMPRTPERATSIAILLRSILAWLGNQRGPTTLMDWGAELHDRFALPFYLERDLNAVFADLAETPFAIAEPVVERLRAMGPMDLVWLDMGDARLRVRHALEFWPLVGDVSSQEGTSRWLDSSSGRVEVSLHALDPESAERFSVSIDGYRVPMRIESTPNGAAAVFGIRYRRFVPSPGLHPLLPEHGPLKLEVTHPRLPGHSIELHGWRPDGSGYSGLPVDMDEGEQRRVERVVIQKLPPQASKDLREPPPQALTPHSFDTRYL